MSTLVTLAVLLGLAALSWLLWVRRGRPSLSTPRDAYTQGLSALISGNRRQALVHLKEAVQGDSENLDAYVRLGDLLRESGEIRKALAVHRDLTVRPRVKESDRVRILESLTKDYLALGLYEEAGQSADRLRHIDRQNRFAYRALQQVAEALRDWPRAIRVVEERAKLEASQDKQLLARYRGYVGSEELEAGNVKEAKQHFQEALKLDPDCLLASLYLGDLEQSEGNMEKAVEHWKHLAFRSPKHASLVFDRLERAFFEMGQYQDVMTFYRELLHGAEREDAVPGLLALAEIHRRKGDLDEAGSFIQEAMEIQPENPRGYRQLIKLAADRNDPQAALQHLDHLLQALQEEEDVDACRHCARSIPVTSWRCPHCKSLNPLGL